MSNLVFTLGGYPQRGNSLFGINTNQKGVPVLDERNFLSYTALAYANGPGAIKEIRNKNLTNEQTGKSLACFIIFKLFNVLFTQKVKNNLYHFKRMLIINKNQPYSCVMKLMGVKTSQYIQAVL